MSDMDGVDWPEELAYEMKERFKKWREEVTSRGGEGGLHRQGTTERSGS